MIDWSLFWLAVAFLLGAAISAVLTFRITIHATVQGIIEVVQGWGNIRDRFIEKMSTDDDFIRMVEKYKESKEEENDNERTDLCPKTMETLREND